MSFRVFAANADLPPAAQNKTISLFVSIILFWINGLLSFKENSDDIRESRSIKLIQNIIKKNCAINVFDSLALENTKQIFKNKLVYCTSVSECLKNSDCVIIMNSEKIFKQISKKNIETMRRQLIIDSRRIIEQKIREMPKTEYVALGVND